MVCEEERLEWLKIDFGNAHTIPAVAHVSVRTVNATQVQKERNHAPSATFLLSMTKIEFMILSFREFSL